MCACPHGRQNELIIGIRCEKDHSCRGMTGENITTGFNPGAIGKPDIHQDDVRFKSLG